LGLIGTGETRYPTMFFQMSECAYRIRPYQPGDEAAVYNVCLKTSDAGQDATHLYSDPMALGHIFVGPYINLEPQRAFVLEDSEGVCGYALGALDSAQFYQKYVGDWLPRVRNGYPVPSGDPICWTPTEKIYHQCYHPEVYLPESFRGYPSHLHLDLLPRAQGQGNGCRMMETLLAQLKRDKSIGVHLAMAASNARAERFYKKLGFHELTRVGSGPEQNLYLAKKL